MHSGDMQSPVQAEALEASLSCSLPCFSYASLDVDVGVGGISVWGNKELAGQHTVRAVSSMAIGQQSSLEPQL